MNDRKLSRQPTQEEVKTFLTNLVESSPEIRGLREDNLVGRGRTDGNAGIVAGDV